VATVSSEQQRATLQRLAGPAVLAICIVLLLHFAVAEPYHVPTGSMAPTLLGRHTKAVCPRCGFENTLGCGRSGCQCSPCQNCGLDNVSARLPATMLAGDHILVNKSLLWFELPRRWEIIAFRLLGHDLIKRIIGMPGELVAILEGDVYINREPLRKSFADSKRMRVPVFDNNKQPTPHGWRDRWQSNGPAPCDVAATLIIDAAACSEYTTLKYQHFNLDGMKYQPITNEYNYNGPSFAISEPVHDFMFECDLEATGNGTVLIGVTDGGDDVIAEMPTNASGAWHIRTLARRASEGKNLEIRPLLPRQAKHHVELALVDRRYTLTVDGTTIASIDLQPADRRAPVISPFWFAAKGTRLRIDNVRLYRDVHYTQVGRNGVNGKAVQMGVDQYFVLGDNSSNSEDSRFWVGDGAVPARSFIGKPVAVHYASRPPSWKQSSGWPSLPDWNRLRWLR